MKNGFLKIVVILLAAVLMVAAVSGCKRKEGEMGKAILSLEHQNKTLSDQLAAKDKEIAELKAQNAKAGDGGKKADTTMNIMGEEMINLMEENAKLQKDVNDLKNQIQQLKAIRP